MKGLWNIPVIVMKNSLMDLNKICMERLSLLTEGAPLIFHLRTPIFEVYLTRVRVLAQGVA
jgi:hypothetical protein